MTSLILTSGHIWSFILIVATQWMWIFVFLLLVEEKELLLKFEEEDAEYRRKGPMLIGHPACLFEVLSSPLEGSKILPLRLVQEMQTGR